MKLNQLENEVWDNAKECDCDAQGCEVNHKLCAICNGEVIYTAHYSNQPNSKYAWNLDHIIRKRDGGKTELSNLQITHPWCNSKRN